MQENKFERAKAFLSTCRRLELRDHAFGDVEISWYAPGTPETDEPEGCGYFGSGPASVGCILPGGEPAGFDGKEALALRSCGTLGAVERNDMTGPDTYAEGRCIPALTLEGVRRELCEAGD